MGYTEKGIGYQHRDTSLAAAEDNEGNKVTLREQVYRLLLQATAPLSTEQVARELDRPYVSVQPRISELSNESRVEDSGKRGKTQWGKSCILWQVRNARV
jgi:hypothetical protein|tara:strand:+ start:1487 stop:1786 length:300 start_codon:yes stop_codon:yes gene_type:complete